MMTYTGIILMTYFCFQGCVTNLKAEITHSANQLAEDFSHFDNLEYMVQSNAETKYHHDRFTKLNKDQLSNSSIDGPALCESNEGLSVQTIRQVVNEHLYDEIVNSKTYQSDTENDHLDHFRPIHKAKPHYIRVLGSNAQETTSSHRPSSPPTRHRFPALSAEH